MEKLTHEMVLQYAVNGIRNEIGSHPCPNEYPEEMDELEAHLKETERRLRRVQQHRTP